MAPSDSRTRSKATLAVVVQRIDDLSSKVDGLEKKVDAVNDWIHTAKGAIITVSALIGAAITAILFVLRRV